MNMDRTETRLACQLYPWGGKLPDAMHDISRLGIPFIECGSKHILPFSQDLSPWNEMLKQYALSVSSVFELGHFQYWRKRREIFWHHERLANLLDRANIRSIILAPGMRWMRYDDHDDLANMFRMIHEVVNRYRHYGIVVGIHPHNGHCIFTADEIDRLMAAGPDDLWLVPDTNQCLLAGLDIVNLLRRYIARIQCIHLNDAILSRPIEDMVFDGLKTTLIHEYKGWITLESMPNKSSDDVFTRVAACLQYYKTMIPDGGK